MITAAGRRSVTVLRAALGALAAVVIIQATLGFAGALAGAPVALAVLGTGAAALWCLRGGRPTGQAPSPFAAARGGPPSPSPSAPGAAFSLAAGTAVGVALVERAWTGLHRTTFLYDVMSYHLHLPAAWRAAGRVTLVPTPFGDPAPAYTPANAELLYEAALAAVGNATLAHAGQLPFAALAVLAIHATARELGATTGVGLTAALAFLLVPEVWQQTPSAMADLAMAAFFLASLPFLLRLERGRAWSDIVALGAALGLMLGTKFVSVVLAVPLLAWTAFVLSPWRRGLRPRSQPGTGRAGAALGVVVFACGGFWYLRNALVAGNPLFPATIGIPGRVLLPGLLDGTALRASEYHLPVADLGVLGEVLAESGWAFCAAVLVAAWVARRSRWPALIAVTIGLLWCAVPYQQTRFFFVVWGLGAMLLAAAVVRAPRTGVVLLLAATAGGVLQFPTAARLTVAGVGLLVALVLARRPFATWGAVVARARLGAFPGSRRARVVVAVAAASLLLATLWWARARPEIPAYVVGDDHDDAWQWMWRQPRGVHVAYAGSNLPLPLWGPRLENAVRYVPIAGDLSSAPHRFLHVAPPAADETPSEPAPERRVPDRAAWLANLEAFAADWLFVARMYHGVARANLRDADNFPIERVWADALPARFTLQYATDGVRIYRLRHQMPRQMQRQPAGSSP